MSTKHTPGPWMVLPSVQPGQFCILTEHGPRIDVACTYGFERTPREANARLIAAAPELLEALQRLQACYSSSHSPSVRESCWLQARSAIAKATGDQP